MVYLDSDILIDILRGFPPAVRWLEELGDEEIVLSVFVVLEMMQGCRNNVELRALQRFLEPFTVDEPSSEVFRQSLHRFGRLRLSHNVGMLDLLIAQMAIVRDLPLHTFNEKHYAKIEGLTIVKPYQK